MEQITEQTLKELIDLQVPTETIVKAVSEQEQKPVYKCVICKRFFYGHGGNPKPVKERGKCCPYCEILDVYPARLKAEIFTD